MVRNDPIGIFDSGVGGLTVVKALMDQMPDESFIYFGDTAHVPYGSKEEWQLMGYARDIIAFLLSKQVKAIVVACGTHSSTTLPLIEGDFDLPVLGVLKAGARTAARVTRKGKIGVIATMATTKRLAYTREIRNIDDRFDVFEVGCPKFVPLIEAGKMESEEAREAVAEYLQPLMQKGIDSLVLGCTHYPFLAPAIQEYVGPGVQLADPSCETIEDLKQIFAERGLFNERGEPPMRRFYVNGNDESFYRVGRLLIGDTIDYVNKISLD
ncbi:MAG: glutamate racemase [Deltaproteobacteria bacterium]